MRYDFDNDTVVLGSVNSGWSTSFPGLANAPYAYASISVREASLGGTQTITAEVQGVGSWNRLPPGGIRLVPDDSNRTLRFAGDATNDFLGQTLNISNLYNDQITFTKPSTGVLRINNGSNTDISLVKGDVGLSSVENLNAAAIRAGTTASDVGLGNVENLNAAAIRAGTTASDVGLGNVTNESKATMFASPTFTGTVSGVTKAHVGLTNVLNEEQVTVDLGNAPASILNANTTKADVGLSAVENLNAAAIRAGTTKADVGLENVTNESKATMFTNPTFTGTVAGVTKAHVGLNDLGDLDSAANTKLSGIASGANNYVLPSGVPTGVSISGTTLSFTTGGGTVNLTTQDTNTTYSANDFNITQLAGYSDANYKNSSIDQSFIETAITNNTTFLQDIGAPSTATTDNLTNKTQNLNTSGNISSSMTVGSTKVTIDPANERILIAD
jgi:hypothetical protein